MTDVKVKKGDASASPIPPHDMRPSMHESNFMCERAVSHIVSEII